MRVLILSAILACAIAAPSHIVTPVVKAIPLVAAIPAAIPTIDPGDIQAAAIDAKVYVEDQAQAAVDKARELTEQAVENTNEKVNENNDLIKEKTEETFWGVEDKKWQALDAVRTAEAKIDGAVANNAVALAKSAFAPVVIPQYVAPLTPYAIPPQLPFPSPIITPVVSPILYTAPGFDKNELLKIAEGNQIKEEGLVKTEEKIEESQPVEAVKSEEAEKEIVKSAELEKVEKPLAGYGPVFVAPPPSPTFLTGPAVYSFIPQYNVVPQIPGPVLTPVIRTQW